MNINFLAPWRDAILREYIKESEVNSIKYLKKYEIIDIKLLIYLHERLSEELNIFIAKKSRWYC